jgi:YidC/Oxa1 family membrane protein insertase
MEQKNNANFILFIVLTCLILSGSLMLQSWLNPPRPHQAPSLSIKPAGWFDMVARTSGPLVVPSLLGPGGAWQLSASLEAAQWLAKVEYRLPATLVAKEEPKPAPKVRPVAVGPPAKHQEVQLGDDQFNLKVRLTSKGAGVLSVTLNQFQAADSDGRPVSPPEKLELIPKSLNQSEPSNKVLLYANPDADRPDDALGTVEWKLESYQQIPNPDRHDQVVFVANVPDLSLQIRKTFTLRPTDYHVGLSVEFKRTDPTEKPLKIRSTITSGHGLPIEGEWYTSVFRNALVGGLDKSNNFWRDYQDSRTIALKGGERVIKGDNIRIQYGAVAGQYFASVVAVTNRIVAGDAKEIPAKEDFIEWAKPAVVGTPNKDKPQLTDIGMELTSFPIELKGAEPVVQKYLLYYGPVKVRLLHGLADEGRQVPDSVVNRYIDQLHLSTLTDYHSPGKVSSFFWSIGWTSLLIKCTNFMLDALGLIHRIIPNYGLGIIVLTLLVRGMMHPISRKQAKTSLKMQALAPEIKKLKEKYKDDRQALQMAQMELYRKNGAGFGSTCWVVLLQMPVFLGLYYALQESIYFRLAPFLWIKNLAAPDMLLHWGPNIPLISMPVWLPLLGQTGPLLGSYLNLLPIFAVALMIMQQKLLTPPPADEQAEMQQKLMKYMMIFFGFMFYKVAAGLCIYFIVSSGWGLVERKLLPKAKPVTPAGGTSTGPERDGPGKGKPPRPPSPRGKGRGRGPEPKNGSFSKIKDMWQEVLKQAQKK